jgi:hypothetical protein
MGRAVLCNGQAFRSRKGRKVTRKGFKGNNIRPGRRGPVARPLEERFWEKVERRAADECWPWLGGINDRGRGYICVVGKMIPAARVAWELANGKPLPADLFACHTCDNGLCCNAAHIYPGTPRDNQQDCVGRGRHACQKRTHCAQGHPYDEANTIIAKRFPDGRVHRKCRICHNVWAATSMARKRAKLRLQEPSADQEKNR